MMHLIGFVHLEAHTTSLINRTLILKYLHLIKFGLQNSNRIFSLSQSIHSEQLALRLNALCSRGLSRGDIVHTTLLIVSDSSSIANRHKR